MYDIVEAKAIQDVRAIVIINADFLDQVSATTIEDSVALDIKQRVNNDKFKVEEDLLYIKE